MNYKKELNLIIKQILENIPNENHIPQSTLQTIDNFQQSLMYCGYSIKELKGIINYMDSLTLKKLQKMFQPIMNTIKKEYTK